MIEDTVKRLWNRIPAYCRLSMISTFIMGLVTHMFMLVNKLPNGDDLSELYHFNSMITSGRWLDILSKGLTSYYSIPWATGLVCLLLLAVSAALICSLLGIRTKSGVLAASAVLVTFPTMASYFSYMYYMDLYMLTLLFSVWAVYIAQKRVWGFLPGALAVALALGNYQAYLGVTAVLALLVLIRRCLTGNEGTRQILLLALRFVCMAALGLLLYFAILRGALYFFAADLSDYQGIAGMGGGALGAAKLLQYTKAAYTGFLGFFFHDAFFTSPLPIKALYAVLLALCLPWLAIAAIRRMREEVWQEGLGKCALLLLSAILLPIGYNLIYFMAPDAFLHSLMQPQYALFWLMPLMARELAYPAPTKMPNRFQNISQWVMILSTACIVYFSFLHINISYLHLHLKYEITYATELRILDRIEALPGYRTDTPVCVLGAFPNDDVSLYPYHTQDVVSGLVGINGNLVHHYYNYNGFFKNYLGRRLQFIREDDLYKAEIAGWPEVRAMPLWPKEGAVSMVRGVVVVKINE